MSLTLLSPNMTANGISDSPTIRITRNTYSFSDPDSDSDDDIFQDALEHQPPNTTSNLFNLWDDTALSDTSSVQLETTTDDDISTQGDDTTELPSLFYSQRGSITSHSSSHTLTSFPATRRQTKLLYTKASQSIPVIPTRGTIKKLSKKAMSMPITLVEEGDIDLDEDLREVHSALQ